MERSGLSSLRAEELMPRHTTAVANLYVHVPFCDGKCDYCGFYSVVADEATRQRYAGLPSRELRALLDDGHIPHDIVPRTLYFGGGTPGMLGADGLRLMAEGLHEVADLKGLEEWTVELNPATTTPLLAQVLAELGVNRVSLGAQCFDDNVLKSLGRRHDAAAVESAVRVLRAAGITNLGVDLIAGLPGLTPHRWKASVEKALALDVRHMSVYALGVEPNTALAIRVAGGEVIPDEEAQLTALAEAERVLLAAGFARYEISNYARPGWECRHNLACWRGEDYVGLGPAASSRVGLQRWTNRSDLISYMTQLAQGAPPPRVEEMLDTTTDATERFVFGLRMSEGVRPAEFIRRYPAAAARGAAWEKALSRLATDGTVEATAEGAWRLTSRGREVADAVLRELV